LGIILAARGFSYRIGKKTLLEEIDFEVRAGERWAIIGPNGAGKSTLLKAFCRILPPGEGLLLAHDKPLSQYKQKALARWISYVPQASGRDDLFTVREFVVMGRYPHLSAFSTLTRRDWEEVERVLDLTGMTDFAQRRVCTLSGGEQQKTLIAAALVQGAHIMLLDEPTAFLDPYQQSQIHDLLETLHQETGKTLIEVTHDINRAALGHDRILGLRAGRVVFTGSPEELMTGGVLQEIYGRSFKLFPHPETGRTMVLP